jgi:hypothetical protein
MTRQLLATYQRLFRYGIEYTISIRHLVRVLLKVVNEEHQSLSSHWSVESHTAEPSSQRRHQDSSVRARYVRYSRLVGRV